MKLPSSINILGYKYLIKEKEEPFISEGIIAGGDVVFTKQEISVVTGGKSYQKSLEILIHEISHVIKYIFDEAVEHSEKEITEISKGITSVLSNNPELLQNILENTKE